MRRRQGFTIVELLVAMALIMFIMSILSTAFVTATTLFRNLKAVGDMANKLRSVTTLLQRDLAADHFEGKKRLSDPTFWVNGPPTQGFFRIWQGSPSSAAGPLDLIEGVNPPQPPPPPYIKIPDLDGIYSYRSVDHMLAFTVKLRGVQMGDFMTAGPNGGGAVLGAITTFGPAEARYQMANNYNYQWAEVAWFLQAQIDPNTGIQDTTSGGIPLWTLYRHQNLAVPDNSLVTQAYTPPGGVANAQAVNCLEVSHWQNSSTGYLYFNSPMDLTMPYRRFGMSRTSPAGVPTTTIANVPTYPTLAQQGATGNLVNADIQATDVVSFDVRLLVSVSINPTTGMPIPANLLTQPDPTVSLFNGIFAGYQNGNPSFSAAAGPRVFDTWSSLSDNPPPSPNPPNPLSNYSQWNVASTPQAPNLAAIPLWNASAQSPILPAPIILAIQITIRVWDMKTEQTREVTIVQAM